MDGGRTHRGPQRDPPPVLKTEEPTGTQPLPTAKDTAGGMIWQGNKVKKSLSRENTWRHPESTDMVDVTQDDGCDQVENPEGDDGNIEPVEGELLDPGAHAQAKAAQVHGVDHIFSTKDRANGNGDN